MGSCTDEIGQTLAQRLLAHAALHDSLIELDACEQARWADDLRQAAAELARIDAAPVAIMDTRIALGLCAPSEANFPALYALQGRRVRLVDLGPNVAIEPAPHDADGARR